MAQAGILHRINISLWYEEKGNALQRETKRE